MNRRQLLTTLPTLTLAGCTSSTSTTPQTTTHPEPVEILSDNGYQTNHTIGVKGIAENVSNQELSLVTIDAKFYTEDDTVLESSMDTVTDLGAGEKWQFEIPYPGMDTGEVYSYGIRVGDSLY